MTSESVRSVDHLAREAETARTHLTNTLGELNGKVASSIDDLKTRLGPSNIKDELSGYVREESSQLVSSLRRKAKENPLQAVAVGAAVIYPFWGLLSAIRVPLLLIGGGLWLSKNNSNISHAASEGTDALKESLATNVSAATDTIHDTAQDLLDAAATTAGEAVTALKGTSADALERVSASASSLGEESARIASHGRTALEAVIDKSPLLVGGIALAIGAFIAASIPISAAENRLFGDGSDEVKDKARGALAKGVDNAKSVATDIVGDIAAAADREGLSSAGISKTIESAAAAIKTVVDKSLTSALGDDVRASSSDPSPDNLS